MLANIHIQSGPRTARPYQLEGVDWLRTKERAFLTDGFGLGKTSQAIWAAETPALIAAPVHLLEHWKREILACIPTATVAVAHGSSLDARKRKLAVEADFYVVNTELLRTDLYLWFEPLRPHRRQAGTSIKTFIIDEAHRTRGRNSRQSQGAQSVAARVPRLYLLTATPVYNQPDDLYAQLHMVDSKRFPSYWQFQQEFLAVMQAPYGPKVVGLKKGGALKAVFKQYAMGRTREDVKAQLPALQESVVELTPDQSWYDKYEHLKYSYRNEKGELLESHQAVLQGLRSYTQQPKLQAVCQLIQDNNCASHTLIYTYHKDLAYAIGHLLKAPVITGDVPPRKREEIARAHDFVVATFPSVAEGLNLSHMQNVIFMEHDWQAGMMEQAMNRVHRPGNPHAHTFVYNIVVKHTVDSVLYGVVKKRGVTMQEIVEAALVPFNIEDVA